MICCAIGIAVVSVLFIVYKRGGCTISDDFRKRFIKWAIGYRRHFDIKLRHCRTTPGGPYRTTPVTDLSRWRVDNHDGVKPSWSYVSEEEAKNNPQSLGEMVELGMDTDKVFPPFPKAKTPREAADNSKSLILALQQNDGHWLAETSSGVQFLFAFTAGAYLAGVETISLAYRQEMIRQLRSIEDIQGGWSSHSEGARGLYGTISAYVTLRGFGVPADDPICRRTQRLIKEWGGCTRIATWGKMLLATMNLYDWEGINKGLPELWLFPEWFPLHPKQACCMYRLIFSTMMIIQSRKMTMPVNPLILELRKELFPGQIYEEIDFKAHRNDIHPTDTWSHPNIITRTIVALSNFYDRFHIKSLRKKCDKIMYDFLLDDDRVTDYTSYSQNDRPIRAIIYYHIDGPESATFKAVWDKIQDGLTISRDGAKFKVTNGGQCWYTGFMLQTLSEFEDSPELSKCFDNTTNYLRKNVLDYDLERMKDNPQYYVNYRINNKGGFTFSSIENSYAVSDLTGENIGALMDIKNKFNISVQYPVHLTEYGIDFILDVQSHHGGYGIYEPERMSYYVADLLNLNELYGPVFAEVCTVEMTSSCTVALLKMQKYHPKYRSDDITKAIKKGIEFVLSRQVEDGSWEGYWGVRFIYGTYFALRMFDALGFNYYKDTHNKAIERGVKFLENTRHADGGWGESEQSAEIGYYISLPFSTTMQTAMALLALMHIDYPHMQVLKEAARFLMDKQLPNGEFPWDGPTGHYLQTATMEYPLFHLIFGTHALNMFAKKYPDVIV